MKDHRITVRLTAELRRRLKDSALAAEDQALTAYEHAKKAGLIGVARRATPDLSTNPDHFNGFGGL